MLTADQIHDAVLFNVASSKTMKWATFFTNVAVALHSSATSPSDEVLATDVANFQSASGLTVDGRLGRVTLWKLVQSDPSLKIATQSLGGPFVSLYADQYRDRYAKATITDAARCLTEQAHILSGKDRYSSVAWEVGMPWYLVGIIHMREASYRFDTYLHNGDPLRDKAGNPTPTTHVPKGKMFLTWEAAAVDALRGKPRIGLSVYPGDVAAEAEYLERYNGLGYRTMGVPSPYLWSKTSIYSNGKYDHDGHYNPDLVDAQTGALAVRKTLDQAGLITL